MIFIAQSVYAIIILFSAIWLDKTVADCNAVENHGGGGGCDAMIFAAAQAIFWPTRVFGVCSGCLFVLTRFTCGNRGKFHMSCFELARAPEGRC